MRFLIRSESKNNEKNEIIERLEKHFLNKETSLRALEKRSSFGRSSINFNDQYADDLCIVDDVCSTCFLLKNNIAKSESENSKLLLINSELKNNLTDLEGFYENISTRNEKNRFKLSEIANFCALFEKCSDDLNSFKISSIFKKIIKFIEDEKVILKWEDDHEKNSKLKEFEIFNKTKNEINKKCLIDLDLLEQEIDKFELIFSQFQNKLKTKTSADLNDKSLDKSGNEQKKTKEEKKKEYFQKIWDLK